MSWTGPFSVLNINFGELYFHYGKTDYFRFYTSHELKVEK